MKGVHPYFTQTGKDREENPDQYIANMRDGAMAGFKYFSFEDTRRIRITGKGNASGKMIVSIEQNGKPVAVVQIAKSREIKEISTEMLPITGIHPLYFRYEGLGEFEFHKFVLE